LRAEAQRSQSRTQQEKRACGGLEIGLTLVKVLVELHGGSIAAYSQGPGTGSEFIIRLPNCAPKPNRIPALTAGSQA